MGSELGAEGVGAERRGTCDGRVCWIGILSTNLAKGHSQRKCDWGLPCRPRLWCIGRQTLHDKAKPRPLGRGWPWGCRGVKAPPSEPSSAPRAPGRSSGAPATGQFTELARDTDEAVLAWQGTFQFRGTS